MKKGSLIIIMIITLAALIGGCSNGGSVSTNNCKSCGRTFQAGDDAGNYRNIARTNMCNNCYNNYKWAQDVLGK